MLPTIRNYGNYSSDNYGAHTLAVTFGEITVYFSYQTPVAFKTPETGLVCSENIWTQTTGKHLNMIESDHSKRVENKEFERLWNEKVGKLLQRLNRAMV